MGVFLLISGAVETYICVCDYIMSCIICIITCLCVFCLFLSIYPSVCRWIYLSTYISTYRSIHLQICENRNGHWIHVHVMSQWTFIDTFLFTCLCFSMMNSTSQNQIFRMFITLPGLYHWFFKQCSPYFPSTLQHLFGAQFPTDSGDARRRNSRNTRHHLMGFVD